MVVQEPFAVTTFLFTDIEGSTRLWEQEPDRMRPALARHDALTRSAVEATRGVVVKMTGDGVHAAFGDPLDAVSAALQLQRALVDPSATHGIPIQVRCGLHLGIVEARDNDFFGSTVNRAARIMSAAHGGQVLLSQPVATLVGDRLPAGVTLRDLGSVRLRDLASPERVYQLVHPELRGDFPVLRSLEATPNNLPQQVTSFIGRERELADVEKLLRSARLVTLVGAGGLGKTRLSLQAAADVIEDFPDGVWFVELAPLTDPALVPQVVASVLGVKEEAGRPVIEALVKYVGDRELLMILDNCEHMAQACAELARHVLQSGPHPKVLASSREPLHVAGETVYPLPSLTVPDPSQVATPTALMQSEGARLFVDRANAVEPAFQVTDRNAAAVAEICQRLDGIPLALELAAARVRSLSVENIAARLSDRFRLLKGGDRTALRRQQTLRALIDWSYDLLSGPERVLLRRLAVFAGGWTLEAAEAVAAGGDLDRADVLDLLAQLVEKSLVALEAAGERYRLLETMRQYAQERLDASDDRNAVRTRHLDYYLDLAEKARPELVGSAQGTWLARLDVERENLLAAHRWCDSAMHGAAMGLRLVNAVKIYWLNRGLLGLGHRVMVDALARPGAQERGLARCRGLFDTGQLGVFMGRYEEAQAYLDESLAIARELGDRKRIALVLQPLGIASMGLGDLPAARGYFEEGLALAREQGDKREIAAAQNALAQFYRMEGALDAAEPLYLQSLGLARELDDRESIAIGLLNLAIVSVGRGEDEPARRMLNDVIAIADEIGSKRESQSVLEISSGLAGLRGDWQAAARFFGAAEAQASATGLRRDPADEAFLAPWIAAARNAMDPAAFAAAEVAGRRLSYVDANAEVRSWLLSSRFE